MDRTGSDHSPISLTLDPIATKQNFPFRFERMWTSHPNISLHILEWWNIHIKGTTMFRVAKKLKNINSISRNGISQILTTYFNPQLRSQRTSILFKVLFRRRVIMREVGGGKIILTDLHNIIGQKEAFQRQRLRVVWLREGDRNTRLFHISIVKHKVHN